MVVTETTEYGPKGLLGVLTPQANTTVEPELWTLLPPGWSMINARLTSAKNTIEERLVDYTTKFDATAEQFANAPVSSIAAACTGASYLIGADAEEALIARLEARFARPFLTAARASVAMLHAIGATRVALLSPYPESLNAPSRAYWEGFGFDIVAVSGPRAQSTAFHPIYAMVGDGVLASYRTLSQEDCDVVLMLGTGMATLGPIVTGRTEGLAPAVSCNVALAWAATQGARLADLDGRNVESWLKGACWSNRLRLATA